MIRRVGVLVTLLVAALVVCSASTVSLDGTKAYTREAPYPSSCSCAENGVTMAECTLFKCECACDVTAGACDYNCCCDPDCSAEQKTRFGEVGCADEGHTLEKTDLCYDSTELYKINPRLPLGGQSTAEASVGGALCVEKYNGATSIDYHKDTAEQAADIFTVSAGTKAYTYGDKSPVSATMDANFDQGDSIAAFSGASASSLFSLDTGYLSIPAADFDGACNDHNFAQFEKDVNPSRSCQRKLKSSDATLYEAQCEQDFSVARYVTELYVGTASNVRATTTNPTAVKVVTLSKVSYRNIDTNAVSDVTAAFKTNNCASTYQGTRSSWASSGNCLFYGNNAGTAANLPRCQNMVTSVKYTVTHSAGGAGTISAVSAEVVIEDVPRDASKTVEVVTQSFGIDFVSTFGGTATTDSGNLVGRARSGNPGYIMGKPVVSGVLAAAANGVTLKTITMDTEGVQVATSLFPFDATAASAFGAGLCPASVGVTSKHSVAFGYDMTTGCTLSLNRAELKNMCCTGSSDCTPDSPSNYVTNDGVPHFLALPTADQYVGMYGNADPLDVSQWTKVSVRASSATPSWSASTGVCKNMKTGLHYRFLVAASGEKAFPQAKIVAAEVEQVVSDLHSDVPNDDAQSKQTFPLEITVSFVTKDSVDLEGYVPPAPPVLFKVPHDVFYPFFMSPAAPKPAVSVLALLAPIACALALVGANVF